VLGQANIGASQMRPGLLAGASFATPYGMARSPIDPRKLKPATRLVAASRRSNEHGMVNPPVYHASTVLFDSVEALHDHKQEYVYGRRGTPTIRALELAIAELEGGFACKLHPSGLSAATTTLLTFLKPGDHLLMTDAVYRPVRTFCDGTLQRLGVMTTYYDPEIGAAIASLIRPETRLLYLESPGSQTMEVQDVPAMAAVARQHGLVTALDNTWSAGHFFKAFEAGCDVSIQSATKYISGHSDVMLGAVTCSAEHWEAFKATYGEMGLFVGPDDVYLGLRGLRTLDVRLRRHMASALKLAEWLKTRPEVVSVLYPALPSAPGHDLWARDFTGACGLFSILLEPVSQAAVAAMLDGLELFGMGYSWGGFESLALPFVPVRTASTFEHQGPAVRLHIGLEDPDDLIADLEAGFARLKAHS
jgi:cysteine-S-conjugate beta-lyase